MFLKYKILNLSLQYSNIIVRLFKAETTSFLCLKYFKATIFKWLSEHLFARWPLIATLTAIILKGVSAKPRHLHAILYNSLLLRSHRINYKQYWYSTAPNCFHWQVETLLSGEGADDFNVCWRHCECYGICIK